MKAIDIIAVTVAALIFMLVTGIAKANPVDKITNWLSNEKTKIVDEDRSERKCNVGALKF